MSEFTKRRLSDLASIVTGSTPSAAESDSWGDELDFITPSDQRDGVREAQPARRLSVVGARRLSARLVPAQSTNLTCIGSTIGKVSMSANKAVTNQQINSIVAVNGVADPAYLYYMIRNWSPTLKLHASGSATPIVNKTTLANYEFLVPQLLEQRAIAEVLGALDDKIAANARLIDVADQLSQASFQSVAADSGSLPLSATARFVNGKAFTKGASGTGRVVIRIAELNSGIGGSTVHSDAEVDRDYLARSGDILFAWSGSLTLHRWFREDAIINQHIFKVVPNGYPSWVVYGLLRERLSYFKGVAADKATTMGHIQRRHLDELVKVPSRSSIERLDGTMTALWERTLLAERENTTLAATRDALLPQLMSGALRVKDAEKAIEEVA